MEAATRVQIEQFVPAGARILDVGVGMSWLSEPLDQYERHGIDITLDFLEKARAKGINAIYSRIEGMPYVDATFDAVVTTDVLEHVFDLSNCTRQILRVLKPGGVLIIRVPLKEDLDVYLREDLPYEFVHMRSFDAASLRLHFSKYLAWRMWPIRRSHTRARLPAHQKGFLDRANPAYATLRRVNWLTVGVHSGF